MSGSQDPLVSFVVPAYNYARYLGDCLDSILGQDAGIALEVVVIDDCSTDDTPDVIARYHDPRLRPARHAVNQGHVVTINEGMAAARGTFIARIDADDRYRPHFLRAALAAFAAHGQAGLVYGDVSLIGSDGQELLARSNRIPHGAGWCGNDLVALLQDNFIPAPTVIARREAWQCALPIPQGYGFSDWYLTLQMARRYDFCYLDDVVADYRVHAAGLHNHVVADYSEERTIMKILGSIFGQPEVDDGLQRQKQQARGAVYGRQYLMLADKYFGRGMNADARRCYLLAARHAPGSLLRGGAARRAAATLLSRRLYERGKQLIKAARS